VSIIGYIFVEHLGDSRIVGCAVSSQRPPQYLDAFMNNLAEETLTEGEVGVVFLQEGEFSLLD
jgi:hypothetical protein